jgi:hypothetical protein
MTRLANIAKAGYFPLPDPVTELVQTHLAAPHGGRILDPCAGEGEALVGFAGKLGLDPFGVELHEGRAEAARQAVNQLVAAPAAAAGDMARRREDASPTTRVLHDSYLNLITSRSGYNFLYLNPRMIMTTRTAVWNTSGSSATRPWLQPGGLLVWVVPQHLLKFRKATRYILSWYDRVQVYRFPDDYYERFRQIVLFGVHRPKAVVPDGEMVERWRSWPEQRCATSANGRARTPLHAASLSCKVGRVQIPFPIRRPGRCPGRSPAGGRLQTAWREHLDPAAPRYRYGR